MKLPIITLTGIDRTSPLNTVEKFLAEFPRLEFGILYTHTPEGRNRYPTRQWILSVVKLFGSRCAIHICGERARTQFLDGWLDGFVQYVPRIQINGRLHLNEVELACSVYRAKTIITQHTLANAGLLKVDAPNHAILLDESGGRGIVPESRTRPATRKPVGYAGGIGPENITATINSLCIGFDQRGWENNWWVDMEGKMRDENDWFCFERARAVAEAFHDYVRRVDAPLAK